MAEYTYGKDFAIRTETDCIATENDYGQYVGRITAVKIKTNADRLRAMTDEEMAEFMQNEWFDIAICNELNSTEKWLAWLRKDAKSD